jgi:threonine dehydrogenase-like Zn-dependent dehydrogenase
VLECSGHDGAALDAVKSVRSGGEVVLVGSPWTRKTDATAHDLLVEVFHRYVVLRSGWEWHIPALETPFTGPSAERNTRLALRWLLDGTIDVSGMATRHSPAEAQSVFEALADRTAPAVTALFDWR